MKNVFLSSIVLLALVLGVSAHASSTDHELVNEVNKGIRLVCENLNWPLPVVSKKVREDLFALEKKYCSPSKNLFLCNNVGDRKHEVSVKGFEKLAKKLEVLVYETKGKESEFVLSQLNMVSSLLESIILWKLDTHRHKITCP